MRVQHDTPTISDIDHVRLAAIARSGQVPRRFPPSATLLSRELDRASVRKPQQVPVTVIRMGSRFAFCDGFTDRVRHGVLVFPGDEVLANDRISILSPLGSALIGMSEKQRVRWQSATGQWRMLEILRVDPHQSGRAGE